MLQPSVVQHHRRPGPDVHREERERPEGAGERSEGSTGRQSTVLPGEARHLEPEPSDDPVDLGDHRYVGEPGDLADGEQRQQRAHQPGGVAAEPPERERCERRVDHVVREEPQGDGCGVRPDADDPESTRDGTDDQGDGPEPGERRCRREQAVQTGRDPVSGKDPIAFGGAQRRRRGESADEEEQGHDLTDPGDPAVVGGDVEQIAAIELAAVDDDDHAQPVPERHDAHGGCPVEVDRPVAIGRRASGEFAGRRGRFLGCGVPRRVHLTSGPPSARWNHRGEPPDPPGSVPIRRTTKSSRALLGVVIGTPGG